MHDKAVKALIIKDRKVLLIKQTVEDKTYFSLPGGRIKDNDYTEELKREVKEETNLDIEVLCHIGDWSFQRSNGDWTDCMIYRCNTVSSELSYQNSDTLEMIEGFIWLNKNEINNQNLNIDSKLLHIIQQEL